MKYFLVSIRFMFVMTIITGILYPLAMTGVGKVLFRDEVEGSLIRDVAGNILGSKLIAQKFESDKYFHSRPSAGDFATVASGASNLGPTSATLRDQISQRKQKYGADAPVDLLTTSGSGLDPHLSLDATTYQVERVSQARNLSKQKLIELISRATIQPVAGFMGVPMVNILELNIALDAYSK